MTSRPFICCGWQFRGASELLAVSLQKGVSFSKPKLLFIFLEHFPCLKECKHSSQPGIPTTCTSDHECHENSGVFSLSEQPKALSSLGCCHYPPVPWQNQWNFCFENALSLFEETWEGRDLGVNGEVGEGCEWRVGQMDSFDPCFSYFSCSPEYFIIGFRETPSHATVSSAYSAYNLMFPHSRSSIRSS